MKISEFLTKFTALTSTTQKALDEANKKVQALETRLEKMEADSDEDDSKLDDLLEQLRQALNEDAANDKSDSDEDSDSDGDSDSDDSDESDSSDDEDDNESKAKAVDKKSSIKALASETKKLIAKNKKLKAEAPKQVINTLASIGIPTPVATKVDGSKTTLKGLARVSAAFTEQLKERK